MKKLVIGLVFILIMALVARGIQRSISASKEKVVSIPELQQEAGIPVFVVPVLKQTIQETRIYSGTIKGKEQADATAKVMERLDEVTVRIGSPVKKGQIVARLNREYPIARYQQAQLALENAEKEYARMKALFAEGAISQRDLDNVELQYKIAQEDFKSASELLNVISPISGVVTEIFHDPGETVAPGEPVIRIASLSSVEVEIDVSEADISDIKKGQKSYVLIHGNEQRFEGIVDRLSLSADPEKRNFRVWVSVSNKNASLMPGMFATVNLVLRENPESLVIDKDGLVKENSTLFVFVVNGNSMAEKRKISTGINTEKYIQVLDGIQEGEQVVVLGQNKLNGGEKVKIIER